MTDYNNDQARELRRARLVAVRPNNALAKMDERQYTTTYKGRHMVVREMMTEVEEAERIMFCPACQEQVDDAMIAVRQLHVSYEEDPLRNYRALVTLCCKGCGWNEIVPVESPPRLTEEELTVLREARSFRARDQLDQMRGYQAAQSGVGNASIGGGLLNQQHWSSEMQRQLAKQSVLGQMYGAGPNVMKSLLTGRMGSISGMSIIEQAKKPVPVRGQALADAIWSDYAELDKMRAEAVSAKQYVESWKIHDQVMQDMAKQLAKKVDEDILSELKRQDKVKVPPRSKYAAAPPPPPKLDQHDKEAMREMLMEEVKRANGDPSRIRQAFAKVKEFFT